MKNHRFFGAKISYFSYWKFLAGKFDQIEPSPAAQFADFVGCDLVDISLARFARI